MRGLVTQPDFYTNRLTPTSNVSNMSVWCTFLKYMSQFGALSVNAVWNQPNQFKRYDRCANSRCEKGLTYHLSSGSFICHMALKWSLHWFRTIPAWLTIVWITVGTLTSDNKSRPAGQESVFIDCLSETIFGPQSFSPYDTLCPFALHEMFPKWNSLHGSNESQLSNEKKEYW